MAEQKKLAKIGDIVHLNHYPGIHMTVTLVDTYKTYRCTYWNNAAAAFVTIEAKAEALTVVEQDS